MFSSNHQQLFPPHGPEDSAGHAGDHLQEVPRLRQTVNEVGGLRLDVYSQVDQGEPEEITTVFRVLVGCGIGERSESYDSVDLDGD